MTTSRKRWLWLIVLLVLISLGWAGCNALRVDHRKAIAQALLLGPGGSIDDHVFAAALNARFPAGAKATALGDFFEAMGGNCSKRDTDVFSCELDESGAFCVATKINIEVQVDTKNAIRSINAKSYLIGW